MKINEILINPSRENYMEKYYQFFKNSIKTPAFKNLEFAEHIDIINEKHYLGLFDKDELISYLEVEIRELILWQINYTQTDIKFRGQGCFRYLLTKAVITHDEILSDDRQTNEAKSAWQRLIEYQDGTFQIFLYDAINKKILGKAKDFSEDEIWNNEDKFLLAKKTSSAQGLMERTIRNHKSLVALERDHYGLWYGPRSSNGVYENP
jgi:hypothetical protein